MAIYKALIDTPCGYFIIAVDCEELSGARKDIYNVAYLELAAPTRIKGDVKKSNSRILSKMLPIKNARIGDDTYWAWILRVKGN